MIFDQHKLAFKDVDKLIFGLVPMPKRRARPRRQAFDVHADLRQLRLLAKHEFAVRAIALAGKAVDRCRKVLPVGDIELWHLTN